MRRILPATWLLALPLVTATTAVALGGGGTATSEPFTGGTNAAGWSFIRGADVIETEGGNPGAWLHNSLYDTFAPILENDPTVASAFTGDFRAKGVTSVAFDARTISATFGAGGRQMSLLLRDTKGTPDVSDDDYAYFVGAQVPQPGEGWVHYDFPIPSASTAALPAGWTGGWAGDCCNFRPGVDWNDVITNVDRVEFWWLDPALFAIFQQWNVGADNVTITEGGGGPAASVTTRNGSGLNPETLSSAALPVLGSTWTADLDCSGHAPAVAVLAGARGPRSGLFLNSGELLIDLSQRLFFLEQLHGGATAGFSIPLPNDPSFCGFQAHVQGLCIGAPGNRLSNALDLVLGS